MFDADRPITTSTKDHLNRALFAKYLARCLLDHKDPESLVVGLYGSWGVGKTSIINLVREELEYAASNMIDDEKPVILNFSVWSYSGQNQLIYSFFRRLSSALRSVDYLENSDRIIHLLELYVSFFTHQPIPKPLRSKKNFFKKIFSRSRDEVYAWESGRDLTLVKAELNELLSKQKHKIIINIDNISLLYDYEIKQIFQIVKSMGDYANTEYLLAFDKEKVVRSINLLDGGGGEEFIEKIVQLPFVIPPILHEDLENIFADRVNEVIATVPADTWNSEYWAEIYYSSFKFLFENCRDITRYVNTLSFSYSRLKDVVNPVDFFALTAIEVFLPKVYFALRDNKDLFTDLLDNVYELDKEQLARDRMRCEEILSRTERISKEILLELLMHLFPRLRRIYYPNLSFYHSELLARKLRRICSPDLFDIYFRLSMQSAKILDSEFTVILRQASEVQSFDQALTRLNQDDRIIGFLNLLDNSKVIQNIPKGDIPAIVNALMDNGDLFPPGMSGPLSLDTAMRIHRIIHALLRRVETAEERFLILQNAIAYANKSLYISIQEIKEQAREHSEESDTFIPLEFRVITPEQLESLRKLIVTRIKNWAQTGRLAEHPQLLPILFAWKEWGNEQDCYNFVTQMTKKDQGFILFLTAALKKPIEQAMTQYEKDPSWMIYIKEIESLTSVKELEKHAKILFEDEYFEKLREKEQLALMIFLDLLNAKTRKIVRKTSR